MKFADEILIVQIHESEDKIGWGKNSHRKEDIERSLATKYVSIDIYSSYL